MQKKQQIRDVRVDAELKKLQAKADDFFTKLLVPGTEGVKRAYAKAVAAMKAKEFTPVNAEVSAIDFPMDHKGPEQMAGRVVFFDGEGNPGAVLRYAVVAEIVFPPAKPVAVANPLDVPADMQPTVAAPVSAEVGTADQPSENADTPAPQPALTEDAKTSHDGTQEAQP